MGETEGDLCVHIEDVLGLRLQEAFVDEVEEEFEKLGSRSHLDLHLLQMVLHVVHVEAVDTFEVEKGAALGSLIRDDQHNDLCFRQVNQDSAILTIALDLLQCRNATPEQVLQVFKAIVDLDGKGWVVSAFRYRLCQLLVHIAESNLDLVSQIVDVPSVVPILSKGVFEDARLHCFFQECVAQDERHVPGLFC